MADLLTAKDLQELLHIDRSTIYRMAEDGRLPAIKVGKQWRFPADQITHRLNNQAVAPAPASPVPVSASQNGFASLLPQQCVQLIQDTYADALEVMLVITDLDGRPVTQVSNPCGLFKVVNQDAGALQRCIDSWYQLGRTIELEPKFTPSHLGLLCARSLVRVGTELKGMVIVGGIAPENWPPSPEQVQAIAAEFGISPETMSAHLNEVYYLDDPNRAKVLSLMQRIADVVAHIINERYQLLNNAQAYY
jgi:excisionase family DNA binding protein